MAVTVYIPTSFRRATSNRDRVEVTAIDVSRLLDQLEASYGGLKGLVRDEGGEVHHHVNIYVNSEAIESLQGLRTPLKDGDEVTIIPALAGGGRLPACAGSSGAGTSRTRCTPRIPSAIRGTRARRTSSTPKICCASGVSREKASRSR